METIGIEINSNMITLYKSRWNYNGRKKRNYISSSRLKIPILSKNYKQKKKL